jgi:hypothetical protein
MKRIRHESDGNHLLIKMLDEQDDALHHTLEYLNLRDIGSLDMAFTNTVYRNCLLRAFSVATLHINVIFSFNDISNELLMKWLSYRNIAIRKLFVSDPACQTRDNSVMSTMLLNTLSKRNILETLVWTEFGNGSVLCEIIQSCCNSLRHISIYAPRKVIDYIQLCKHLTYLCLENDGLYTSWRFNSSLEIIIEECSDLKIVELNAVNLFPSTLLTLVSTSRLRKLTLQAHYNWLHKFDKIQDYNRIISLNHQQKMSLEIGGRFIFQSDYKEILSNHVKRISALSLYDMKYDRIPEETYDNLIDLLDDLREIRLQSCSNLDETMLERLLEKNHELRSFEMIGGGGYSTRLIHCIRTNISSLCERMEILRIHCPLSGLVSDRDDAVCLIKPCIHLLRVLHIPAIVISMEDMSNIIQYCTNLEEMSFAWPVSKFSKRHLLGLVLSNEKLTKLQIKKKQRCLCFTSRKQMIDYLV